MTKQQKFQQIKQQLLNLPESELVKYRNTNNYQPVPGAGSLNSNIMFIGEAPGKKEGETGQPFVGAAGKVLTQLIESINLTRDQVFITSIVHDRPPNNRDPKPEEIATYAPILDQLITLINPKVIACLGRHSMKHLFDKYGISHQLQPISKIHGNVFTTSSGITLIPLYHPAVALYSRKQLPTLQTDFSKLTAFS